MKLSDVLHRIPPPAKRLSPDSQGPGRVLQAVDRVERFSGADRLLDAVQRVIQAAPLGRARDGLHGRWLGHPVHPLLVQVPVGSWLSAALLDVLPGQRRAAGTLVATGLMAAAPAALAGWVDWADCNRPQQRIGFVHAAANAAGVALYASSLSARLRGRHTAGKMLGWAGLTVIGAGGALGGHLAYRQAAGANHAEAVAQLVGPGWHHVAELSDLPHDKPVRRTVADVTVVVVRRPDDAVHVLAEHCSHLAGPLSEGVLEDGCLRCPWHGSLFRLTDGWNVQGPATAPQPAFDTRVTDGRVEARLRQ
ncbi:Ferredoxin subunit of nitrite reductase or a ring-hydroxylating dioxygenase [Streptomyces sp. 2231.1]|uniref:Rieske 2Fe-2S domain-containing protein n=1 Tax=Streptomyces sp. 2231.1 TaxID=1855347 RepID=UPI000898EF5E|nr:Rieske (2Fe-2S) protein [Streptomyces sp. 2231.1]SEC06083.1 Ferredoxin subunit of nitrite reductase or a ring-hydroxylating dioxygenase [Streptomyces sp. 2231.1]